MTKQYILTVTVLTDDEPLSDIELKALDNHIIPSSVVIFGEDDEQHFFIENIKIESKLLEL